MEHRGHFGLSIKGAGGIGFAAADRNCWARSIVARYQPIVDLYRDARARSRKVEDTVGHLPSLLSQEKCLYAELNAFRLTRPFGRWLAPLGIYWHGPAGRILDEVQRGRQAQALTREFYCSGLPCHICLVSGSES